MKLSAKILATFFIILSLVGASLLWLTRVVDLASQSLYFDQPNLIWYIMLHIGIIMAFFTMNASFKKPIYGLVAFASLFTLMLDVGSFTIAHNIFTVVLFILACVALIIYGGYRLLDIILCSLGAIVFLMGVVGLFGYSGIFLGEFIAETLLATVLLIQIWKNKITKYYD